jgi:CheY-like chemotaxis protein
MSATRILTVDDNPMVTWLVRVFLENDGYIVREENESQKALQTAREFQPDLVLLDFYMPGIDGCEVARQFAADDRLKSTQVVFLTGSPGELLAKGPPSDVPFIPKPASVGTLRQFVREHLPHAA